MGAGGWQSKIGRPSDDFRILEIFLLLLDYHRMTSKCFRATDDRCKKNYLVTVHFELSHKTSARRVKMQPTAFRLQMPPAESAEKPAFRLLHGGILGGVT